MGQQNIDKDMYNKYQFGDTIYLIYDKKEINYVTMSQNR